MTRDTDREAEERRRKWEQAESHRKPEDGLAPDAPNRPLITTPEPDDQISRMRRGEFPPGVGERELRDPGRQTPGAPPTRNES